MGGMVCVCVEGGVELPYRCNEITGNIMKVCVVRVV